MIASIRGQRTVEKRPPNYSYALMQALSSEFLTNPACPLKFSTQTKHPRPTSNKVREQRRQKLPTRHSDIKHIEKISQQMFEFTGSNTPLIAYNEPSMRLHLWGEFAAFASVTRCSFFRSIRAQGHRESRRECLRRAKLDLQHVCITSVLHLQRFSFCKHINAAKLFVVSVKVKAVSVYLYQRKSVELITPFDFFPGSTQSLMPTEVNMSHHVMN